MSLWGSTLSYLGHDVTVAGGDVLTLGRREVYDVNAGDSNAGFRLGSDGKAYQRRQNTEGAGWSFWFDWVSPLASASNYECTHSVVTGVVDSTPGAPDSYVALTSDRDYLESSTSGFEAAEIILRIRKVGEGADAISATIYLEVDGAP